MKRVPMIVLQVALALAAGCASDHDRGRDHAEWARRPAQRAYRSGDREVRRGRPPVPSSAMPSPGACRVWYPGRRVEEQPRAGACRALARRVPLGAWLLHRPQERPGILEVATYSSTRRGVVERVVVYELDRRAGDWDPRDDDPGWARRPRTGGADPDGAIGDDRDDGAGDTRPRR